MSRDTLRGAAGRAERLLLSMPVLESLLARRDLGHEPEATAELMAEVAHELCASRESDGSFQHSVSRTAEHLLLLRELDHDRRLAELARPSVEWLRGRLRAAADAPSPRATGRLCTPLLHEYRVCSHHAQALLLVVPADVDLGIMRLLNGAAFTSDLDARVALASLSLAALISWDMSAAPWRQQVLTLHRVIALEEGRHGTIMSTNGLACVALALLAAAQVARPLEFPEARAWFEAALQILVGRQRGDGTWPSADLFFVLSVIVQAAGVPALADVARAALRRPAQQLALLQQPDGGWSRSRGPWPLLIGWRVLLASAQERQADERPPS
jgi:hypothetical protein